jgi:predicted RNA binding protein YcfA (HicA-like mRNA interferase family)
VPRKIRELMADLKKARFENRGGKGSHRNFVHPTGVRYVLSGNPGDDVHHYQEKDVREKIAEAKLREEQP